MKKRFLIFSIVICLCLNIFNFKKVNAAYAWGTTLFDALSKLTLSIGGTILGMECAEDIGLWEAVENELDILFDSPEGVLLMDKYNNDLNLVLADINLSYINKKDYLWASEDILGVCTRVLNNAFKSLSIDTEIIKQQSILTDSSNLFASLTNNKIYEVGQNLSIMNTNPFSDNPYTPNDYCLAFKTRFMTTFNDYLLTNYIDASLFNCEAYSNIGEFASYEPITELVYDEYGYSREVEIGYTSIVGNIYSNFNYVPVLNRVMPNTYIFNFNSNTEAYNTSCYNTSNFVMFTDERDVLYNQLLMGISVDKANRIVDGLSNMAVYQVARVYYEEDNSHKNTFTVHAGNVICGSNTPPNLNIRLYSHINSSIFRRSYIFHENYGKAYIAFDNRLQLFEYISDCQVLNTIDISHVLNDDNYLNINVYSKDPLIKSKDFDDVKGDVFDKIIEALNGKLLKVSDLDKALDSIKSKNKAIADKTLTDVTDVPDYMVNDLIDNVIDVPIDDAIDIPVDDAIDIPIDDAIDYPIDDAIDYPIGGTIPALKPSLIPDYSVPGNGFKNVFPFCLPFDLYEIIECLKAEPKAPVIEIPMFKMNKNYSISKTDSLIIDFSSFDLIAKIFRYLLLVLVLIGFIKNTNNLVGGGKT